MAEDSQTVTEETTEAQDESEETEETETPLVEVYSAKGLPKGWVTRKTLDVEKEITLLYTCPVRKSTVYMKFGPSWGPEGLKVWIQVYKDGGWVNAANMEPLYTAETIAFVFDEPHRYRIFAKTYKDGVRSNKCRFRFVGLA